MDPCRAGDETSAVVRRQWDDLSEAELHAWTSYLRAQVTSPEMTVLVARDKDGVALAVLAAIIDDSVCVISFALATGHE